MAYTTLDNGTDGDAADGHVDVQRHQFLDGGALVAVDVEHFMEVVKTFAVRTE